MAIQKPIVFVCFSKRAKELGKTVADTLETNGYETRYALRDTDQGASPADIYRNNIKLIRQSDIFVAVLDRYGKDLATEVGYAKGLGMPAFGLDYNADPADIMLWFSLNIIQPESLLRLLCTISPAYLETAREERNK